LHCHYLLSEAQSPQPARRTTPEELLSSREPKDAKNVAWTQAYDKGLHRSLYAHPRNPRLRSDYASTREYRLRLTSCAEEERPDDATFSIGVEIIALCWNEVYR